MAYGHVQRSAIHHWPMRRAGTNVPLHGNYHGLVYHPFLFTLHSQIFRYYSKRHSVSDPRLAIFSTSLFAGKRVLDIGCNEGWVTCELGNVLAAQHDVLLKLKHQS
jgi:hypothetical protein